MSVEAVSLFNEIKDPNEIIITLFFNACAQLGTEKELKLIKAPPLKNRFSPRNVQTG